METNEKQVSNNIKSLIKKYGLNVNKLADIMGVSRPTISQMVNHPFKTNLIKLNNLANNIGCNLNDFFVPLHITNSDKEDL